MGTITSPLTQSASDLATEKARERRCQFWIRFIVGVILFGMIVLALLRDRMHRAEHWKTGMATINRNGEVMSWSPEAAAITGEADMMHRDLFSMMTTNKRARYLFDRWADGGPYKSELTYGGIRVKFRRDDDASFVAVFSLR